MSTIHQHLDATRWSRIAAALPEQRERRTTAETEPTPRELEQHERMEAAFGPALSTEETLALLQESAGPILEAKVAQAADLEEEEPLQAKAAETGPRGGLPEALRSGIEALSGMDLSDVQVHADSPAPAALQAQAFARGNEIHLAPGQHQHLAHEAWHVVQQRQGRVPATGTAANGTPINDDAALEAEADRMAREGLERS